MPNKGSTAVYTSRTRSKKKYSFQHPFGNLDVLLYAQDFRKTISLVPTSAITGEGIPDLLFLLCQLTQNLLNDRLLYSGGLQCTVLEVKQVEGLGMTIDVILVNGTLKEGDVIVVCGLQVQHLPFFPIILCPIVLVTKCWHRVPS